MIQNLFQVLQNSPRLESLTIESIRNNHASSTTEILPGPIETLELPVLLAHLAIRHSDSSLAIAILNSISTSRLHFMTVIGDPGASSVAFFEAIAEPGERRTCLLTSILENTLLEEMYLEVEFGGHIKLYLKTRMGGDRSRIEVVLLNGERREDMDEIATLIRNGWAFSAFDGPATTVVGVLINGASEIKLRRADFEFILKLPSVQVIAAPPFHSGRVALLEFLTASSSHPSLHHLQQVDLMDHASPSEEEELKALAGDS